MGSLRDFFAALLRTAGLPALVAPLTGALVGLALLGLARVGQLEALDLVVYDATLRTQPHLRHTDPRVVVIGITDPDRQLYGRPLPDKTLERALALLLEARPRAIGVDLQAAPASRRAKVVSVERAARDLPVDRDGVVRRAPLLLSTEDGERRSLALALAQLYVAPDGVEISPHPTLEGALLLGETPLARTKGASGLDVLLDFAPGPHGFRSYTLRELLEGEVGVGPIHDRVVLVGLEALRVDTPLVVGAPGVLVHAHAVGQLLRIALEGESPIRELGARAELAWILGWSLLGALLGLWRRTLPAIALLAIGLGVLLALGWAALFLRYWIPVAPAALGWVLSAVAVFAYTSLHVGREHDLVARTLGPVRGHRIATTLLRHREMFLSRGRLRTQRLDVTVMVLELTQAPPDTPLGSGDLEPEDVMRRINERVETMCAEIQACGGVIDRFAGDGVVANFGVPFPRQTEAEIDLDTRRAVQCALAIGGGLARRGDVRMRAGIATGRAVVGRVGSRARQKYSAVGAPVNGASALARFDAERFAAEEGFGCRILVGEETAKRLGVRFRTEPLPSAGLPGRGIHRVLGESAEPKD